jgi:HEPN domain-containing protein
VSFEEAEILRLRAEAFLRNAERLYAEGEYDLAAFNIEQHCQLVLKYKLLVKTGAYPRALSGPARQRARQGGKRRREAA